MNWAGMDSNHRNRTIADLQSAPFDRSGTYPCCGLQTADTVCGGNLHKVADDCKPFFNKSEIFLQFVIPDAYKNEDKANSHNDEGK